MASKSRVGAAPVIAAPPVPSLSGAHAASAKERPAASAASSVNVPGGGSDMRQV